MGFEQGGLSFRVFYMPTPPVLDDIVAFAQNTPPPLEIVGTTPAEGWVSWRHLLDNEITQEKCFFEPWLLLSTFLAEKKVPKTLLKAFCSLEEDRVMLEKHVDKLSKEERAEIKQRVFAELSLKVPPTLSGMATAINFKTGYVLSGAISNRQIDAFCQLMRKALDGCQIAQVEANGLALLRKGLNADTVEPACFTDARDIEPDSKVDLGREFLTWLWYNFETEGGEYKDSDGTAMFYTISGPFTFFREGRGAFKAILRDGLPEQSPEAGLAIMCGKKMESLKMELGCGDNVWKTTLTSDLAIKGLKLPKELLKKHPSPDERMESVETFLNCLYELFDLFLTTRFDMKKWGKIEKGIATWSRKRALESEEMDNSKDD